MQTFSQFNSDVKYYNLEVIHSLITLLRTFDCANGCGAKGGVDFPDSFLLLSIESACNNHDIDWKLANHRGDLIMANYRFRRNMEKIIDIGSANWLMRRIRYHFMNRYYTEVKMIGTNAYSEERGFV